MVIAVTGKGNHEGGGGRLAHAHQMIGAWWEKKNFTAAKGLRDRRTLHFQGALQAAAQLPGIGVGVVFFIPDRFQQIVGN